MANPQCQRLLIKEKARVSASDGGRPGWIVEVELLGSSKPAQERTIYDPLSTDDHEKCKWYLGRLLDDLSYLQKSSRDRKRAREGPERLIGGYGAALYRDLGLKELESLYESTAAAPLNDDLEVEIHESSKANPGLPTLHNLWWEQLETPNLFPSLVKDVTVKRVILVPPGRRTPLFRPRSSGASRIYFTNVLLVIARKLTLDPERMDRNPSLAQMAILEAQRKLNESGRKHRIRLEIVRPGTFASFKKHMERKRLEGPDGYFHIVHFDAHGFTRNEKGCVVLPRRDIRGADSHTVYLKHSYASLTRPPASEILMKTWRGKR